MKKGKQAALILALVGAFIVYWAQTHSPKANLGQIVGNELSGSYTMSETSYYISMVAGIALLVLGVYRFVKGGK